MVREPKAIRENALLKRANRLYSMLPVCLQFAIDEAPDSGLESEELPDGYERLTGRGDE